MEEVLVIVIGVRGVCDPNCLVQGAKFCMYQR